MISEDFNLEDELKKIPDQMAFKIGDVADLLQVKPYVLRYWEQEFKSLNPKKAVNNQRIYSRRDVETVILIKKFLYVDQFSIAGARKALKEFRDRQIHKNIKRAPNDRTDYANVSLNLPNKEILESPLNGNPKLESDFVQSYGPNEKSLNSNFTENVLESVVSFKDHGLQAEKYILLEEKISKLLSKIKSVKGKLEHKFFQIGL